MKVEVHNRCDDFTSYRAARVKSLFNAESGANFDLIAEIPDDPAKPEELARAAALAAKPK